MQRYMHMLITCLSHDFNSPTINLLPSTMYLDEAAKYIKLPATQ